MQYIAYCLSNQYIYNNIYIYLGELLLFNKWETIHVHIDTLYNTMNYITINYISDLSLFLINLINNQLINDNLLLLLLLLCGCFILWFVVLYCVHDYFKSTIQFGYPVIIFYIKIYYQNIIIII